MVFANRLSLFNAKSTCLVLLAIWSYAFWPTIQAFFNQGLLIAPIILTLILSNNSSLKRAHMTYNHYGLLLLILCAFIWLLATIAELELLRQIATLCILMAIVLNTCGKKVAGVFLLPFLCLFLLLPIGGGIYHGLLELFSWCLVEGLTLCKQSVYWEGNRFFVNNNAYDIYAYLSGLKYTQLYIATGACFAMLNCKNTKTCIIITLGFLCMPFVILLVSMYTYIILHFWFNEFSIVQQNLNKIGWGLTVIGLIHAGFLGFMMRDRRNVITNTDDIDWHNDYLAAQPKLAPRTIVAACIIFLIPIIAQQIKSNPYYLQNNSLPNMPSAIPSWQTGLSIAKNNLLFSTFQKNKNLVNLSISAQLQPIEKSWKQIKQASRQVKLNNNKLPIQETILHKTKNQYKVVWSMNYVNGHFTNNKTLTKALQNLYHLSPKGSKQGVIAISTDVTELNVARERLTEFLQDFTQNYN